MSGEDYPESITSVDLAALPDAVRALPDGERAEVAVIAAAEMSRLGRFDQLTPAQEAGFTRAVVITDACAQERTEERATQAARVRAIAGGRVEGRVEAGAGQVDDRHRGGPLGDGLRAGHEAIAAASRSGLLPDSGAERATALLDHGAPRDRSLAGRWAAAAGDPDYAAAFAAVVMDPVRGHLEWTPEQSEAYRTAKLVQDELRAMSLTDAAGGYMVPLVLDPAIMLTSAGVSSTLRARARVVTTIGDSWNGVTSAGTTSEWLGEASEAADGSPTLGQPSVPVYKLSTFVPYSVEVGMDGMSFLVELQRVMLDSANSAAELAYAVGDGSGKPTGLVTGLVAATTPVVASASANAFAAADIYALQNALGPRWQAGATWHAPLVIINLAAQFETTSGAAKFPEIGSGQLLRRPLDENSSIDGTYGSGENYVMVYGNVAEAFVIADRVGATFELIPHLFGNNNRPTGQRGAWLYQRTGSNVVVPAAAKVLNVT